MLKNLLKTEGLRLYLKIKKAPIIAFIMRLIFCYNRLELTIDTKPNGDKKVYIFDEDTMIDYEWIALQKDQNKLSRSDKTTVEWFYLSK